MRLKRIGLASLVVPMILGSHAPAQPRGGPPPARVQVDGVRLETVERKREVTGEIRALRRALVAAEEPGLVAELNVDIGSVVSGGDIIARLKDQRRRLDVERLEAGARSTLAEVQEREAQVAKAQRDLDRLITLQQRAGASDNEVDDARTALTEANARLAQAQADHASATAEVATALARLEDMTIRAPFDGSVVLKGTEIGEWVREGDTVIELVALEPLIAVLDVPERFLTRLHPGQTTVRLMLDALEDDIEAPVRSIVAQGDRLARTFPVLVAIPNEEGLLRPGLSVRALVPTGEPIEALTIHKDAMLRSEVGVYVWVDAGGRAQSAPVDPLFAVGERVVVRAAALREGMNAVIEGNETLFAGQPLIVDRAGAPAGGSDGAVSRRDE